MSAHSGARGGAVSGSTETCGAAQCSPVRGRSTLSAGRYCKFHVLFSSDIAFCQVLTLLLRPFSMTRKLTFQALDSRVAGVSYGAAARAGMLARLADRVCPAWVDVACIPAGALHAFLRVAAVPVGAAGRGGGHCRDVVTIAQLCSNTQLTLRFTLSAGTDERVSRTDADDSADGRAVLHLAGLAGVAGPGGARIATLSIDAGLAGRTVAVHLAAGYHSFCWEDAGHKAVTAEPSVAAALRLVRHRCAGRVLSAGVGQTDRAAALRQEVAGLVRPTVVVSSALDCNAGDQRVALQSGAAHTAGRMELHSALGAAAAGALGRGAGVQAVLVDTGLVQRTVVISATLGSVALAVGVPAVSLGAGAHRVVGARRALGLRCARVVRNTGVDAVLVDASLVRGTVGVGRALGQWLDCNTGVSERRP